MQLVDYTSIIFHLAGEVASKNSKIMAVHKVKTQPQVSAHVTWHSSCAEICRGQNTTLSVLAILGLIHTCIDISWFLTNTHGMCEVTSLDISKSGMENAIYRYNSGSLRDINLYMIHHTVVACVVLGRRRRNWRLCILSTLLLAHVIRTYQLHAENLPSFLLWCLLQTYQLFIMSL